MLLLDAAAECFGLTLLLNVTAYCYCIKLLLNAALLHHQA